MINTVFLPMPVKKIGLPNQKIGKKIDLNKLFLLLDLNDCFKARFDKEINPKQNWIEINIEGKAKLFSNGTVTTNLNLPDEALLVFFEKFYNAYISECLL